MKNKLLLISFFCSQSVYAGSYIFAGEANGTDIITHPQNYTGTGGVVNVSVCIDPTSVLTTELEIPVQNIVQTWNQLSSSSPNLFFAANNNIPSGQIDWESVTLHEVGHCIGLAHPNLGSRNGVSGSNTNYTNSTDGAGNSFNFGSGNDGIIGSDDDQRGDNVNLHWFNRNVNNPYVASPPYDSSNYSVLLSDLPVGDSFPANADILVGNDLGFQNSEAVMQQGSRTDEDQRRLGVDDVSTIRLGMSGIDVTEGTADDYTLNLTYGGIAAGCDINIKHHDISSFAFCSTGGAFIGGGVGTHLRITTASIEIDSSPNWFFNTQTNDLIFANGFE